MLEETFRVPWPHHRRAAHERPLTSPRRTSHHFPLSPLSARHKGFISASDAPSSFSSWGLCANSPLCFHNKLHGWVSSCHPTVSVTTSQTFVHCRGAGQPLSHLPTSPLGTALRSIYHTCCLVFCVPVSTHEKQAPRGHRHCPFTLCPQLLERPLWGLQQGFDEWIDDVSNLLRQS